MGKQRENKSRKRKTILGITGSFGSGKTTVARIFKSFGAALIDADKLAHECLRRGSRTYKKIVRVFGTGILKRNKEINRKKLAGIVFDNKDLLTRLNRIIHPQVIKQIRQAIRKSKSNFLVLDVPLLIESGLHRIVDKLVVVRINRQVQLRRIKKRTSLGRAEILKRIRSQLPLKEKTRLADFIIDNSGSLKETRKQAEEIRRKLWKS